jgi:hypothetical protein
VLIIIRHIHTQQKEEQKKEEEKHIMIETCETCLNETAYNCTIDGNGILQAFVIHKVPQTNKRQISYQDLYKCKFELARRKEMKKHTEKK